MFLNSWILIAINVQLIACIAGIIFSTLNYFKTLWKILYHWAFRKSPYINLEGNAKSGPYLVIVLAIGIDCFQVSSFIIFPLFRSFLPSHIGTLEDHRLIIEENGHDAKKNALTGRLHNQSSSKYHRNHTHKAAIKRCFFIDPIALQNLISSCPVLESLNLSYYDSLELTIRAPNLKFLTLEGDIKDIFLENTPMLVSIDVSMYMSDDISQHFGQNSTCNFDKFLGGVPSLQKLIGRSYFTKYMSIGNTFWGKTDLKYQQLKVIELSQVSFDTMKEIMVVLRLILNSPNLEELQIAGSSDSSSATEARDLGFWEKECRFDQTFDRLKFVKMMDMIGVPHEVGFIGFLLGNSPVLENMSITPSVYMTKDRFSFLMELTKLKRRSSEAEMIFVQNSLK
ncbi:hypothetical protein L2E82_08228 [Cichorium intybus]|uniref:Uncharacterized protein n=1 Tax=Cichorium intybus TaxID=13427 RepID=A0ACB9G7V9_CICIN|nr:hypothetical protein L2E82_08228 [Cichorium intybus]